MSKPETLALIRGMTSGARIPTLTDGAYHDLVLELRDVPEIVLRSESVHWGDHGAENRGWIVRIEVFPTVNMLQGKMSAGWLELCQGA